MDTRGGNKWHTGSSGGHGRAGSSGGHGRWSYSRNSYYPPKISLGKWGGIRSPPGLNRQTGQYKTRQERPPGPDRQDRTAHRNQKPSWAGLEAEASSGHDQESEALTGSLSDRLHICDMPQTSLHWQDKVSLKCSCGHNKTDTRHSWPWRVDSIHGARDSGGQRAWVSANPVGLSQRQSGGHWVRGGPAGIESEAGQRALSQRDLPRMARLGERQPGN